MHPKKLEALRQNWGTGNLRTMIKIDVDETWKEGTTYRDSLVRDSKGTSIVAFNNLQRWGGVWGKGPHRHELLIKDGVCLALCHTLKNVLRLEVIVYGNSIGEG